MRLAESYITNAVYAPLSRARVRQVPMSLSSGQQLLCLSVLFFSLPVSLLPLLFFFLSFDLDPVLDVCVRASRYNICRQPLLSPC
jgi:hypothetical protein